MRKVFGSFRLVMIYGIKFVEILCKTYQNFSKVSSKITICFSHNFMYVPEVGIDCLKFPKNLPEVC